MTLIIDEEFFLGIAKAMARKYMDDLTQNLCNVQPVSIESISDPATGENIFTWSYAKQIFENNSRARWEDDGGSIVS
jgi:hypothetical protein